MKIMEFLSKKAITADLKATDKEGVIREMVDLLVKADDIKNKEELIKALLTRESLGSTGIGQLDSMTLKVTLENTPTAAANTHNKRKRSRDKHSKHMQKSKSHSKSHSPKH